MPKGIKIDTKILEGNVLKQLNRLGKQFDEEDYWKGRLEKGMKKLRAIVKKAKSERQKR